MAQVCSEKGTPDTTYGFLIHMSICV